MVKKCGGVLQAKQARVGTLVVFVRKRVGVGAEAAAARQRRRQARACDDETCGDMKIASAMATAGVARAGAKP